MSAESLMGPGGRIRTYVGIDPPVLQTGAFDHSATPGNGSLYKKLAR